MKFGCEIVLRLKDLGNCRINDNEKIALIRDVVKSRGMVYLKSNYEFLCDSDICEASILKSSKAEIPTKYCPKCGRKFPESENVCMDCLVHLKNLSDVVEVSEVKSDPKFLFKGKSDYSTFDELLSDDNLLKINQFNFNVKDFEKIIHDIKLQVFKNFDMLVKSNEIYFDSLDILDKIVLFAKSIVKVDYKSSGGELGYYHNNTIYIDDRQTKSLQITTLIHELSHFLLQEILTRIICKLLDTTRNSLVESLVIFVLSFEGFTRLIDEYSAHNVEGRFTMFGYQDYSSFEKIERELEGVMSADEIDITKSIGNNFALSIKEILEALIDRPLREDIKDQFLRDVLDKPNYRALEMENCTILNDEAFMKSIWLMVNDGSEVASKCKDQLMEINSGL